MKSAFRLLLLTTFLLTVLLPPVTVYLGSAAFEDGVIESSSPVLGSLPQNRVKSTVQHDMNDRENRLVKAPIFTNDKDTRAESEFYLRKRYFNEYGGGLLPEKLFAKYGLIDSTLLIPHDPIIIDGNSEFQSLAANESWSGNGSFMNPYIIENYNITSTTSPLILIKNTNLHFILKNNLLKGSNGNAVVFNNVTNGMIENNEIADNGDDGIYLDSLTSNILIANNTITGNGGYGINAFKSMYHRIEYNLISDNTRGGIYLHGEKISDQIFEIGEINVTENVIANHPVGMLIQHAKKPVPDIAFSPFHETIIIINTTFINNTVGIRTLNSNHVRIVNATINGTASASTAVEFKDSSYNTLNASTIVNYQVGVHLVKSSGITVNDNFIAKVVTWGIFLDNSPSNIIYSNELDGAGLFLNGIFLKDYQQASVFNNTVSGKPLLFISDSVNGNVSGDYGQIILLNVSNYALTSINQENSSVGLMVLYGNNVNVSDSVFRHDYDGIFVWQSSNLQFNNVSVNAVAHDGLKISYSDQVSLMSVNVSAGGNLGVYMEQVATVIMDQLFVTHNGGVGIQLQRVEEINITQSVVSDNGNSGLVINDSVSVQLLNLTMENNFGDGLYIEDSFPITVANSTIADNDGNGLIAQSAGTTTGSMSFLSITDVEVIRNNLTGMFLNQSDRVIIQNSMISNNSMTGIKIIASESVTIMWNLISNNGFHAIDVDAESSGLLFQWNDVITNNVKESRQSQAADDGKDNRFDYNHWSDWTSPDADNDGMVDQPYSIEGLAGNEDPHPFVVKVSGVHLLLPPVIIKPASGDIFTSSRLQQILQVEWLSASDSLGHEITYDVYYSANSGQTWNAIARGIKDTTVWWNVTSVNSGDQYKIKVVASDGAGLTVEAEMDGTFTIDNSFYEETDVQGGSLVSFDGWYLGLMLMVMGSLAMNRWRRKRK